MDPRIDHQHRTSRQLQRGGRRSTDKWGVENLPGLWLSPERRAGNVARVGCFLANKDPLLAGPKGNWDVPFLAGNQLYVVMNSNVRGCWCPKNTLTFSPINSDFWAWTWKQKLFSMLRVSEWEIEHWKSERVSEWESDSSFSSFQKLRNQKNINQLQKLFQSTVTQILF